MSALQSRMSKIPASYDTGDYAGFHIWTMNVIHHDQLSHHHYGFHQIQHTNVWSRTLPSPLEDALFQKQMVQEKQGVTEVERQINSPTPDDAGGKMP